MMRNDLCLVLMCNYNILFIIFKLTLPVATIFPFPPVDPFDYLFHLLNCHASPLQLQVFYVIPAGAFLSKTSQL